MLQLLHPQEIEVYYILPALRRELSIALKRKGLEQKRIAELLGVTAAAVSQYLRNKRASDFRFDQQLQEEIGKAADRITSTPVMVAETQRLLSLSRLSGMTCQIHHKVSGISKTCDACQPTQLISIGGKRK